MTVAPLPGAEHDVTNVVIPYHEMCRREGASLHRGMNHGLGGNHSVILLSVRSLPANGGQLGDGESILIYEGHNEVRSAAVRNPESIDQPEFIPDGRLTQNGRFHRAAQEFKAGLRPPERVRLYQKIEQGVWAYGGVFHLIDSWREEAGCRNVFKFKLLAVEGEEDFSIPPPDSPNQRQPIPAWIMFRVWGRDGGKCVVCGASTELHFLRLVSKLQPDTPLGSDQVQLRCAHHDVVMSDRVE